MNECRTRWGHGRLAAVGLRLGASLALLCAQDAGLLDALVLWEPVASGRGYLDELEHRHREFQRGLPRGGPENAAPRGWAELGGFVYSPKLLHQLDSLDLRTVSTVVEHVLLVETSTGAPGSPAPELLPVIQQHADRAGVTGPRIWLEDADRALVPASSLHAITSWLTRVYS